MGIFLIPSPKQISASGRRISLLPAIHFESNQFSHCAETFCTYTKRAWNIVFQIAPGGIAIREDPQLQPSAYRLICNDQTISLYAADSEGASYGLSTILQLLRADCTLPEVTITDYPDCEYRSLMVDLARQWHPFETLFHYVDICWLYKIKYLHLHFEDNQSYTLCSDAFPKLPTQGRSYTKEQIAQLNAYALSRNVEIIPEVEFPGHGTQKKLKYPELFGNTPISPDAPIEDSLFCVGKPGVMENIRLILQEVIDLFPNSRYIHIGGDEAALEGWNYCVDCLNYMKKNNIADVHSLYTHFTKKITDLVLELGKTPIVWEGFPKENIQDLSRDILVMGWESYYHLANELVDEGFTVINASWQPLYITPERRWQVEDILNWNVGNWQNWNPKSPAYHKPIQLPLTKQVKGAMLGAWEWNYAEEFPFVKENLAALSQRTWDAKSYVNQQTFMEYLPAIIAIADKILH